MYALEAHTYKKIISYLQGGIVERLCRPAFSLRGAICASLFRSNSPIMVMHYLKAFKKPLDLITKSYYNTIYYDYEIVLTKG